MSVKTIPKALVGESFTNTLEIFQSHWRGHFYGKWMYLSIIDTANTLSNEVLRFYVHQENFLY